MAKKFEKVIDYVYDKACEKIMDIGVNSTIHYFKILMNKVPMNKSILNDLKNKLPKNTEKHRKYLFKIGAGLLVKALEQSREKLEQELRGRFEQEMKECREEFDEEIRELRDEHERKYSSLIKQNKRYKKKVKVMDEFMKMFIVKPLLKKLNS